jgi:pimeloyl-ACP methyl ester carboxylesterase
LRSEYFDLSKLLRQLSCTCFAVATICLSGMVNAQNDSEGIAIGPAGNMFWDSIPTTVDKDKKRGDILWVIEREDAPTGAKGWNIIYVTEGVTGRLEYVSGEIYVPDQAASGPRPVIVWNSGTVGFQDSCAPSRNVLNHASEWSGMRVPALKALIAKDYVVVMSDYQGLGTPGGFPFANGRAQGMAALDAARAATQFPQAAAGNRIGLYGFSLGGQSVLWATHLADSYAPELKIIGAVAIAPASRHLDLAIYDLGIPENGGYFVGRLAGLKVGHPELNLRDILTEAGLELLTTQAWGCFDLFAEAENLNEPYAKPAALGSETQWGKLLKANDQFLPMSKSIPMLLVQGDEDVAVPVRITRELRKDLCSEGIQVKYEEVANAEHFEVVMPTAAVLPDWFDARLRGLPVAENCEDD